MNATEEAKKLLNQHKALHENQIFHQWDYCHKKNARQDIQNRIDLLNEFKEKFESESFAFWAIDIEIKELQEIQNELQKL